MKLIAFFLLPLIAFLPSFLLAEALDSFEFDSDAWEDAAEPSPELEKLKIFDGDWKLKIKVWRGNNKNPDFFSGRAKYNWELDERVLVGKLKASSLTVDYEGFGTMSYDTVKKKFIGSWSDTGSPGIALMTGVFNEETKCFELEGEHSNPQSKSDTPFKSEITIESEDKIRTKSFAVLKDGSKKKIIEFVYSRK